VVWVTLGLGQAVAQRRWGLADAAQSPHRDPPRPTTPHRPNHIQDLHKSWGKTVRP